MPDLFGQFGIVGHPLFVQEEQKNTEENPDDQIGRAQPPQAHSGGAHGGEFVMARVIGQGVEQREQKSRRQNDFLQQFRRENQVIQGDLQRLEPLLLKSRQFREKVEGEPEHKKTAQTIAERDEQFTQQVAV